MTAPIISEFVRKLDTLKLPKSWTYKASVTSPLNVDFLQVNDIVTNKNFMNDAGPTIYLTAHMPRERYQQYVFPYVSNLRITITETEVDEKGVIVPGGENTAKTFVAVQVDPTDQYRGLSALSDGNADTRDLLDAVPLVFQLIPETLYNLLHKDVFRVYYKTNLYDLLDLVLSHTLEDNKITDPLNKLNYFGVRGVQQVPHDNTTKYEFLLIPERETTITKLCKWLQEKKGIYKTGANAFFENGWWHVYPLFNFDRYDKEERRLTIFAGKITDPVSEKRTFYTNGTEVFIGTNTLNIAPNKNLKYHHESGNGLSWSKSTGTLDGFAKRTGDGTVVVGEGNLNKVKFKGSVSGKDNIVDTKGFTDNPYKLLSEQAAILGTTVTAVWQKSESKLLTPGMPVKIYYSVDDQEREIDGTLLGVKSKLTKNGGNLFSSGYTEISELIIHTRVTDY